MHARVRDVLENRGGNYLLPFFWQHGEDEPVLREEMARIAGCGIGAVCVESRPHPDFCGPLWWRDMDIIMDEARRRDMKVWVLDDAHFPTGFANGWIRDKFPQLKKIYLAERHMDVAGPLAGASIMVNMWVGEPDKLVAVVAAPLTPTGQSTGAEPINLIARIRDNRLYWDVPAGQWRVYFVFETQNGGGNQDYINPIDPASCRVLIDAVYEPHLEHYATDFGKTLAGFFSDEPNIGNGGGLYDVSIGRKPMVLPWRAGLLAELQREFGAPVMALLPGLWHDIGPASWPLRYAYMNLVSRLYSECFAGQLGQWCTVHGVEYIGHIIEDGDAHTRMGASAPHFFRAMDGQTMSGIDVVLCQIRPGLDRRNATWIIDDHADGEFYHYELAKLGASHAHIDPKKRGRAMCEIFGAYGWAEGLRLMKWLTDHMLVRGINWYVPHAFSPKEFPDGDCPPHFYARGKNPQFRYFGELMRYTNRICHLINDGRHVADAAVLYHAQAEWSGDYMSIKEPLRVLAQAQLDADIVPADLLDATTVVRGGKLVIAGEDYGCLILPCAQRWPRATVEAIVRMIGEGLKVAVVGEYPTGVSEGGDASALLDSLRCARVCTLDDLPAVLGAWGVTGVRTGNRQSYLRSYQYCHDGLTMWMFFNEDPAATIETSVWLDGAKNVVAYDAFANELSAVEGAEPEDGGLRVPLTLSAEESIVLLSGEGCHGGRLPAAMSVTSAKGKVVPVAIEKWAVSTADSQAYPAFTPWRSLDALANLCEPDLLPDFSGTIAYEGGFDAQGAEGGHVFLDLGEVGETAEVWLNDQPLGMRIARPYVFDASALRDGRNTLRVEVTNTLVYALRDFWSKFMPQGPCGLIGPVTLRYIS
ncbi:MAG: hypothetical protein LLG01_07700 [Planctomycetaceae bacterium]|nr:hypothetical protein [Planctomycetaceae bacterium]